MGNITSNIFDLDLLNFSMAYIENENADILPEMNEVPANKKINQAEIFKEKVQNIQPNLTIDNTVHQPCFKEIKITKDNFHQHQFSLLNQKNISYLIGDSEYKFITIDYNVYIISDENLIKMILNLPRPRKIIYKHTAESLLTPSIYSMQLLANILENIKTNTLQELIEIYNYEYVDVYTSKLTLLTIFNKYEKLISKNQYNKYINFEQKIYNIFSTINYTLDDTLLSKRKNECLLLIQEYLNKLDIRDKIDVNLSLEEIVKQIASIEDNNMIFPSSNKQLLDSIELDEYNKLVDLLVEKESISKIINKNALYDTYYNGSISSFNPCIENYTNNIIIKDSYNNLFQHFIAEILRNQKFIELLNDNKNLLEYYLIKNNASYNNNILIMLEWVLRAYIYGCKTEDEYINYIFNNYSTILSNSDITKLIDLMEKELKDLLHMINEYSNNKLITDNIILHEEESSFLTSILSLNRKLFKNLVLEVYEYIEDYNSKNNAKLNFLGFDNDAIYIECDPEALNVGIDTLTRTLVKIYDKYLKKTKANCHIEKLS